MRGFRALLFCRADYRVKNAIDVLQNIVIPEAENKVPHRFQHLCPRQIALVFVMLSAIDFNDQMRFLAAKIEDKATERHLTPELQTCKTTIT